MKKNILLLLFTTNFCFGMKIDFEQNDKFVAVEPLFKRMVTLLKCAQINVKEDEFFQIGSVSFDSKSFYIAVKNQALSNQIFGEVLTKQYAKKMVWNNTVISEVEIPFENAVQYIEKKWGHILEQVE